MKRITFLAFTAALLVSCEKPTGPATHGLPAFDLSSSRTTFSGDAKVIQATVLGLPTIVVGEAGPLDASGGADHSTLLSATISKDQTLNLLALEQSVPASHIRERSPGHSATESGEPPLLERRPSFQTTEGRSPASPVELLPVTGDLTSGPHRGTTEKTTQRT